LCANSMLNIVLLTVNPFYTQTNEEVRYNLFNINGVYNCVYILSCPENIYQYALISCPTFGPYTCQSLSWRVCSIDSICIFFFATCVCVCVCTRQTKHKKYVVVISSSGSTKSSITNSKSVYVITNVGERRQ